MNYKNILSVFCLRQIPQSGTILLASAIIISGIIISGAIAGSAIAQAQSQSQAQKNPFDIQFPVKELGNCKDQAACKVYCDEPQNVDACLAFAEKNNLVSKDDIEMARKFKDQNGLIGPGRCNGRAECDEYCGNPNNMSECISFAEKNGLMPPDELKLGKKVQAAIARGVKPPACGSKQSCDAYCGNPDHMEECMNFAIEAGMMSGKELDDSKKVLQAIKKGVKPPACGGKEACDAYCGSPENMEECMNFAIEAGMMPEEERENSQKMLQAIKKGVKPPACRGREECDTYCSEERNIEECSKFAEAAGFMSAKEAEMSRKTGGRGPGGCKGRAECDNYCGNPDNQETCFQFGKENGMIPEEDLKRMDEGRQGMRESFGQMPEEVLTCLTSSLGADMVEKIKAGTAMLGPKTGDAMRQCFEKFPPPERRQEGQFGQDQPGQFGQPNQQNQPWADMCEPDGNGNPTELACVDGAGSFVASAKVGSDGKPVCPENSTAKCGNYPQNNQQGQPGQPGQNRIDQGQPGQNRIDQGQIENRIDPEQSGQNQQGTGIFNRIKGFGNNVIDRFRSNEGGDQQQQFAPGTGPDNIEGQPEQRGDAGGPNEGQGFNPGSGQRGQNQQGQSGDKFQPGSGTVNPGGQQMPQQAGPGGCKGPEECQKYCALNPEVCKNFQPQQNQQGQITPRQQSGSQQRTPTESNPSPAPMPTPGTTGTQRTPTESNPSPAPMPTPGQPGTYIQQNQQGQFIQGRSGQYIQGQQGQITPGQQSGSQTGYVSESNPQPSPAPGMIGTQRTPTESNPSPAPMPTPDQRGAYIQGQQGQITPGQQSGSQTGYVSESNPQPSPAPGMIGTQITPTESNPSPAPMPNPQMQQQPPTQQQTPPPPPSSFLQRLLGNVIDLFRK